MATVGSLLRELQPELGQVQPRGQDWVCAYCLGPTNYPPHRSCYACGRLRGSGAPIGLLNSVVPISVALNPGRWYRKLSTYKQGNPRFRAHLAALVWRFYKTHRERLEDIAGGPISLVTPVPSKKGRMYPDQPLQQALSAIKPFSGLVAHTLTFVAAPGVDFRRDFYPDCFDPGPRSVSGERVLLVEDSWVTGATAVAAAGALLDRGADSVVILPIARIIDHSFWTGKGHPYLSRILGEEREDFDVARWPRDET